MPDDSCADSSRLVSSVVGHSFTSLLARKVIRGIHLSIGLKDRLKRLHQAEGEWIEDKIEWKIKEARSDVRALQWRKAVNSNLCFQLTELESLLRCVTRLE